MKKYSILLFFFSLFFFQKGFSQDAKLKQEIEFTIQQAKSNGYKLLDSGGLMTSRKSGNAYDNMYWNPGETYKVVIYVQDCSDCNLVLYFYDLQSKKVQYLYPDVAREGKYMQVTTTINQTSYANGELACYVDSDWSYYTHIMLFRK